MIHGGILPNSIDLLDLEILCFLINRGDCDLECVLSLSGESVKLWRRNFLQIKTAITDPDNVYFTGIEVCHHPKEEEAVIHFVKDGGAENFCICHKEEDN